MENMIRRIIEMDKKAQEITADAQKDKLNSERDAAEKAAALKKEYLERARRRIQMNAESERTMAQQRWAQKEQRYTAQEAAMQATFDEKHQEWVDTLVSQVTAH